MRASDLDAVVALIVARQADPVHHIGYLDAEPDAIAAQLTELEPHGIEGHLVAVDGTDDGELIGFLGLEWDTEPPRVWWYGPVVADVHQWDAVADALYEAGLERLPTTVTEQELFHDARSGLLATFAARHGFTRQTASAVLERPVTGLPSVAVPDEVGIEPMAPIDRGAVATLHDAAFAGSHLPGHPVADGARRQVLVAWCRGQGCTGVHLTVREENARARALYDRLGFTEVMIAVPWRIGVVMSAG